MKSLLCLLIFIMPVSLFSQQPGKETSILKWAKEYYKNKKPSQRVIMYTSLSDFSIILEIVIAVASENIGKGFPAFSAHSIQGENYSDEMLSGKVVFINFWFENCPPCIAEFEALNELYKNYKNNKNFQFISFTYEKKEKAFRAAQKYGI